jgi:hypothetical protein
MHITIVILVIFLVGFIFYMTRYRWVKENFIDINAELNDEDFYTKIQESNLAYAGNIRNQQHNEDLDIKLNIDARNKLVNDVQREKRSGTYNMPNSNITNTENGGNIYLDNGGNINEILTQMNESLKDISNYIADISNQFKQSSEDENTGMINQQMEDLQKMMIDVNIQEDSDTSDDDD